MESVFDVVAARAADSLSEVMSPSARGVSAAAATATAVSAANGLSANIGPRKHTTTVDYRDTAEDVVAAEADADADADALTIPANVTTSTSTRSSATAIGADREATSRAKLRTVAKSSLRKVRPRSPHVLLPRRLPTRHHPAKQAAPCHSRDPVHPAALTPPPHQDPNDGLRGGRRDR